MSWVPSCAGHPGRLLALGVVLASAPLRAQDAGFTAVDGGAVAPSSQPAVLPDEPEDPDDAMGEDEEAEGGLPGEEPGGIDDGEAEAPTQPVEVAPGADVPRYTADISDGELQRRWTEDPASLGSMSVGFAEAGRVVNGVQVPPGPSREIVIPEYAWGTQETVDALVAVSDEVARLHPGAPPLRINHIGKRDGGYLRPHQSHQSGRDADLGLYYPTAQVPHGRGHRDKLIDPATNWALVRALITLSDVQVILVDRRIQKVLQQHALSIGEDPAWVDSLFNAGAASLVKHARRHRDHFHVRFHSPRSQELGRRVNPLLALRPDENLMIYRVRRGDTLGHIAMRFGSTVTLIRRANGMRNSFLSLGRTLKVPLRGPCTRCPVPPPVVVPPRRLPPARADAGTAEAGTVSPTDNLERSGADAGPTMRDAGAVAGDSGAHDAGADRGSRAAVSNAPGAGG